MEHEILVHESEMEIQGDRYTINVYCRLDGKHFARTRFGEDDIIINDGTSLEDVLQKHERLLPLAISSRQMFNKMVFSPKKGQSW